MGLGLGLDPNPNPIHRAHIELLGDALPRSLLRVDRLVRVRAGLGLGLGVEVGVGVGVRVGLRTRLLEGLSLDFLIARLELGDDVLVGGLQLLERLVVGQRL